MSTHKKLTVPAQAPKAKPPNKSTKPDAGKGNSTSCCLNRAKPGY